MRFSSAALVAGFASISAAFLVPLEVSEDAVKDTRFREEHKGITNLVESLVNDRTEVIDLECPGCPFASLSTEEETENEETDIVWQEGYNSTIRLEFTTDANGMWLNGVPLFPLELLREAGVPSVKAVQTKTVTKEKGAPVVINFGIVLPGAVTSTHPDEQGLELFPVEFTIVGIDGMAVKVDTIIIDVLKNSADGTYQIARTQRVAFKDTPGAESCEDARSWSLCRMKAMFMAKLFEMVEAAKERASKMQNWAAGRKGTGCNRKGKGGPPRHHGFKHGDDDRHHRHHHHHHHKGHRIARILHSVIRFFIIPALLGVIGGLTASAIGMLVGQAVVHLWRRTYRGGQRGTIRIVQQEVVVEEDEKDTLLSEELPAYEDTPLAEDKE